MVPASSQRRGRQRLDHFHPEEQLLVNWPQPVKLESDRSWRPSLRSVCGWRIGGEAVQTPRAGRTKWRMACEEESDAGST